MRTPSRGEVELMLEVRCGSPRPRSDGVRPMERQMAQPLIPPATMLPRAHKVHVIAQKTCATLHAYHTLLR